MQMSPANQILPADRVPRWEYRDLPGLVIAGLVYFLAARFSYLFPDSAQVMAAIWPASGISLAALLLSPRRKWPIVIVVIGAADFLAKISLGKSIPFSTGYMIANVLEPALAAWLITRRSAHTVSFTRVNEVQALIAAAVLMNGCTALIGAATASLFGDNAPFWPAYASWWVADGMGMLLITPFVVTLMTNTLEPLRTMRRYQLAELVLFFVAWCAMTWLLFGLPYSDSVAYLSPYMVLPLLVWAALRFRPFITTAAALILAIVAVSHSETSLGAVLLGGETPANHLALIQIYVAIIALSAFLLSVSVFEREYTEQELREKTTLLENVINSTTDFIFVKDKKLRTILCNKAFAQALGKVPEELYGKTDIENGWNADLVLGRPEEGKRGYQQDDLAALSGETLHISESANVGSEIRAFDTVKVPVRTVDNDIIGLLAIARDVTKQRQAESEILRSNAELEQFSYAISHDMRQPLRMISSYMKLLETGLADQLDGEKREYFNFAIDGANRMDAMMLGLLDYSRIGRKGEPPTWVESRALLDDALLFLQPEIAEARADVHIEGEWPRIFVSPDAILRLMQNLIGNAIKFRVAGHKPEISVISGKFDNEWHFAVADNGVGIIPDQLGRLFRVFQRLQSRTSYEGTGVGLALCRRIVEHHHGRIWAESAGEGQGSRFNVALPLESAEMR